MRSVSRHVKDIVTKAVSEWFEAREDEEVRAGLEEARDEWEHQGGIEAGEFFRHLKAGSALPSPDYGGANVTCPV